MKVDKKDNIIIERIDSYNDKRFSQKILSEHGAFIVNDNDKKLLYEVEIISANEAIITGDDSKYFNKVIDLFRFYSENISTFFDRYGNVIKSFPKLQIFDINIKDIQPSQFYVDETKLNEISNFIKQEEDIIVPVVKYKNRYISLDGHTRLFYAVLHGFTRVKAYIPKVIDFDYMFFVNEARERNINNIKDMKKLSHSEFDLLWNKFCDENNKKNIN